MNFYDFVKQANAFGTSNTPFCFIIDFEMRKPQIWQRNQMDDACIYVAFHEQGKFNKEQSIDFLQAISFNKYNSAFQSVREEINKGNSYLLNLTFPSKVADISSFLELAKAANAPYRFAIENEFAIFSPECFVRTDENRIYSYPMKGTIDANLPDAQKILLSNQKELWEHNTIVDLIRNDLALVAQKIAVERFRYVSEIYSQGSRLLQVSSEISGELTNGWQSKIGSLLAAILPAGSISGAPKQKTVEIIRQAEEQERGFFTGIFGIFDGRNLDSAVAIRFVEKKENNCFFRSGGGITAYSNVQAEYQEMLDKVFLPS